jgi:FdhE protein
VQEVTTRHSRSLFYIPNWDDYLHDFQAGVPLLRSSSFTADLKPIETTIQSMLKELDPMPLSNKLTQEIRELASDLGQGPRDVHDIVSCLLDETGPLITHWGLLRYLGWTAMSKYLSTVVRAFCDWRNEDLWLRSYCPTCGSLPAMGHLIGTDPGRMKFLSCGCCETRWRYRRIACPFCENTDDHRLATFTVEGESGLRIDHCEFCRAYLKTYVGEGDEAILLSDWTSLHLDIMAQDRGLKRMAASLYALP